MAASSGVESPKEPAPVNGQAHPPAEHKPKPCDGRRSPLVMPSGTAATAAAAAAAAAVSSPADAALKPPVDPFNDPSKTHELEMDLDYVPHFQRVYISGDDNSGVGASAGHRAIPGQKRDHLSASPGSGVWRHVSSATQVVIALGIQVDRRVARRCFHWSFLVQSYLQSQLQSSSNCSSRVPVDEIAQQRPPSDLFQVASTAFARWLSVWPSQWNLPSR